ncbi:hypothetical protein A3A54_01370 [Candidatus Curtissbacteria bacterium RIFCSPLOWO2_01_FULL_39_62]|uniref:ATP phosphoribosyltransferase catalytic domain-containing protein n=2 Tax=Candidatus Curtissiibacteriota TaxID=1752717 RepID=A0A1F5G707_9BACT|nr:MAG: hypothetical protein A3D04_02165 [Candidatus Curtissbacteria bacterium RIFCSPHIGHO2_02_FULL_40_16b]OGD90134.1 MAG: hypothetical protein A3E11_00035 [Candidatus Curtissbacteria bacterium RIFCSPHIGHO2_12_FULL_38_37]OGE00445.1 MAG: hypothetical protein A3A54_01370 [Candidatus Curtissbacteria bacterium RIFCSPLOWO2_01_FULL_39_62]OGE01029.1 MAG: hypothetical protein A3J17_03515 [Candidatus Curtissbacteria bacterium RIFCSPLOWO2_02_FULL_40_11]OGE13811.1 MAG: hypothetical protein A3G14_03395 [Ca
MRIVIPQHMDTAREHVQLTGWTPVFEHGEPADDDPRREELNRGIIEETGDQIIQTRSRDIPRLVAWQYCHVGLVGSDCADGRFEQKIEVLSRFPYGREWHAPQPRVELVVREDSRIKSIEDIGPGAIVLAETQHANLTKHFLEEKGFKVVRLKNDTGPEVHNRLREDNAVAIQLVAGSIPVLLDTELHLGIMVNERGKTVEQYRLRVLENLYDVETLLIANRDVMRDDEINREKILQLKEGLENAYVRVQREFESFGGRERI